MNEYENSTDCIMNGILSPNCTKEISPVGRKSYWALTLLVIPAFALFGNSLVIVSVITKRTLHSAINYFILGLAMADLLLALAVMPFAVYVEFNENWVLGTLLCDAYCAADVTCSTASIFLLTVISFDRYVAATQPIRYANSTKSTARVAIINIAVWLGSMLIASPIILGLNNVPNRDVSKCMFYNADFIIYSSTGSFYIPLVIMLYLYGRIYCVIRRRGKFAKQRERLISAANTQRRGAIVTIDKDNKPITVPTILEPPGPETDSDHGDQSQVGAIHSEEYVDEHPDKNGYCIDANNFLFAASQAVGMAGIRCSLLQIRRTVSDSKYRLGEPAQYGQEDNIEEYARIVPYDQPTGSPRRLSHSISANGIADAVITPTISPGKTPKSVAADRYRHQKALHWLHIPSGEPTRDSVKCGAGRPRSSTVSNGASACETDPLIPPGNRISISTSTTAETTSGSGGGQRMSHLYVPGEYRKEKRLSSFLVARLRGKRSMDDTADTARYQWLRRLSTRLILWSFHRGSGEIDNVTVDCNQIRHLASLSDKKRMRAPRKSISKSQKKEKKATKTLAVVLGIFLICWLPFFTLNLVNAFCMKWKIARCQVSFLPFFFTTWLGYTNSAINPVIYTIFSADFRRAFKEMLHPLFASPIFSRKV